MAEKEKKVDLTQCKLHWDGDQPVVECPKEAIVEATQLIQTKGVLIKEVRIIEKAEE